jgi:cob(I)alamin adenosyltransferase
VDSDSHRVLGKYRLLPIVALIQANTSAAPEIEGGDYLHPLSPQSIMAIVSIRIIPYRGQGANRAGPALTSLAPVARLSSSGVLFLGKTSHLRRQLLSCFHVEALMAKAASSSNSPQLQPFTEGIVEVFTGNGRGKTSAALGVVLRALGQGLRVYIVRFMKGGYAYGENNTLARLPNVTVASFGRLGFVTPGNVEEEDREQARQGLGAAREAMLSGKYDLVVLDEVNVASAWNLIPVDDVVDLVRERPQGVELILTGRHADARLIELAGLVTDMVEVKHPYCRGVVARRGIDY